MEKIRLIERVDGLIRRKSTGNPKELASRLNVSERAVYRIIIIMKEMDAPINFCKTRNSYYYEYGVEFSIGFTSKSHNSYIRGGKNLILYADFFQLPNFGSLNL